MNRGLVLAVVLVIGLGLGGGLAYFAPVSGNTSEIEWLDRSRSLDDFYLDSAAGSFSNESLAGVWSILAFGFLHCPDVCPTGLSQLAGLSADLESSERPQVRFVFVSVDPGRDSIDETNRYAQSFSASFQGVTGDHQQIERLTQSLGIRYKVIPEGGDYSVAHSTTFSIIGPDGSFQGRFRPGFNSEVLAKALNRKMKLL